MFLLNNLAKKEADKKEVTEAFQKALKKGETAGDQEYVARLKKAKQNFDKNASHENKKRLLELANANVQKTSNEGSAAIQNLLSAVL